MVNQFITNILLYKQENIKKKKTEHFFLNYRIFNRLEARLES